MPLCKDLGIDLDRFTTHFESEQYKERTKLDFAHSQQLGVRGFPTLMMIQGEAIHTVSRGFAELEGLKRRMDELLQ